MSEILDFVQRHPLLVGAFVATLGLLIWTEIQRLTRNFADITPQDAVLKINHDDALVIDVREANELGSGISLGHPIGCTGARQMVTGMSHMQRKGYHTGLITMCIGGGMGMAMIVER